MLTDRLLELVKPGLTEALQPARPWEPERLAVETAAAAAAAQKCNTRTPPTRALRGGITHISPRYANLGPVHKCLVALGTASRTIRSAGRCTRPNAGMQCRHIHIKHNTIKTP